MTVMDLDAERFCYLTTTGRKTGRPHEIEIWYAASGRTAYILVGEGDRSDTVRNLTAHPAVRIRVGGETWDASARVVEDVAEAALARELVPRKYAHEEEGLPEWAETALPVAIDLPS
jgi:deazaflavin-dependent oxidoreductase (nitroreductase family)